MGYRVALGLDLTIWNTAAEQRFRSEILTVAEEATFTRVRATAIFYSDNPSRVVADLLAAGWETEDFNWINISKE